MFDHNTEVSQTKVCSKLENCLHPKGVNALLPITDFYREKRNKSGRRADCKYCVRSKVDEWRVKNPQKAKELSGKWRKEHPDEFRDYLNRWQKSNKDKVSLYGKRYRDKHPEKEREHARQQRIKFPERLRKNKQNRRAREANAISQLTLTEWQWLLDQSKNRCVYCGKHEDDCRRLEQDHIVPVTKGGGYTITNIVPACRSCNARKNDRTPEQAGMEMIIKINPLEHMKQRGLFDEW